MYGSTNKGQKAPLIHIGYPKALSKWLQTHLFQTEFGFSTILNPISIQLLLIDPSVFSYDSKNVVDYLKRAFPDHKSYQAHVPVITSEALSGNLFCGGYNGKELADRLYITFPEGRILIIVREQKAMIRSLYNEWMFWGLPHSLKRFLRPIDSRMSPQFHYGYLEYDQLVAYYQKKYGRNQVLVLPFEQIKLEPEKFISAIHSFSNNESNLTTWHTTLPFESKKNPSRTMLYLKIQSLLNRFFIANSFNYSGLIKRKEYTDFLSKVFRAGSKVFDPLPLPYLNARYEKYCKAFIEKETSGKFAGSNQRLSNLINIDLTDYGYDM